MWFKGDAVFVIFFVGLATEFGEEATVKPSRRSGEAPAGVAVEKIRFATFNIQELSEKKLAEVDSSGQGTNEQLKKAAAAIQIIRPDVLMLNEVDGPTPSQKAPPPKLFMDRYLAFSQSGGKPIQFAYTFYAPSNTGEPTGMDLDNDGRSDGPADAHGFGRYPGEYGMVLLSRFPIDAEKARTFRKFRWIDMPNHHAPDGKDGRPAFYSTKQLAEFRLSSKSHWDIPVLINGTTVHAIAAHPTPPIFDGDEDRNGRRNVDELRMLADFLTGGERAAYLRDDAGKTGGLEPNALFVVLGDLNADPVRFEKSFKEPPIAQVLSLPRVFDPKPKSRGGELDTKSPKLENYRPYKTSHFGRIDYVLPSKEFRVLESAVFWPAPGEPNSDLFNGKTPASDHRPVYADLAWPPGHPVKPASSPK